MLRGTGQREEADNLYCRVADIGAAEAALRAKGVVFSASARMIRCHADGAGGWMAFFKDDEGRDLALHLQKAR
jgi:hypothetical protein